MGLYYPAKVSAGTRWTVVRGWKGGDNSVIPRVAHSNNSHEAPDTLATALGTRVHNATLLRVSIAMPSPNGPHAVTHLKQHPRYRPRGLLITFSHSLANYCPVIAIDNPIEATRRCR